MEIMREDVQTTKLEEKSPQELLCLSKDLVGIIELLGHNASEIDEKYQREEYIHRIGIITSFLYDNARKFDDDMLQRVASDLENTLTETAKSGGGKQTDNFIPGTNDYFIDIPGLMDDDETPFH
jgi:hypothetical protein